MFFEISFGMTADLPGLLILPIIFALFCFGKRSLVLSISTMVLGLVLIPVGLGADILLLFIWPTAFWLLVVGIAATVFLVVTNSQSQISSGPTQETAIGSNLVGDQIKVFTGKEIIKETGGVSVGNRIKVFKGKEIIKETGGVSVDGKLYSTLLTAERAISESQWEQ
jgi:hypothetical protein